MRIEIRSNDYAQLAGYKVVTQDTSACKSSDDGTGYQVLTITTDANRVQTAPDIATSDCYVVLNTGDSVCICQGIGSN